MTAQRDDMAGPPAAAPAPDDGRLDDDRIVLDDPVAGGPVLTEDRPDPAQDRLDPAEDRPDLAEDRPDTVPAAALAEQQWPSILALFVDDPRGAVERAAAAAGAVTESIVATLEREQAQLRASVPDGADTEELRTALQRYRAFCGRLEDLA